MARIPEYQIEYEASQLRERFNLGDKLPVDITGLLLKQGILTIFTPMSPAFSGMCLKYKFDTNFMLINSTMVLGRQNFTVAHELYHLFVQSEAEFAVHQCEVLNPQSPIEKHANAFASHFLMPKVGVIDMMQRIECTKKTVNPAHIISMCSVFGVSYQAMLISVNKILNLSTEKFDLLKNIQPVAYANEYSLNKEVFEKPNYSNLVVGDYTAKAQALYDSELISKGHLIELLSDIKFDKNGKN